MNLLAKKCLRRLQYTRFLLIVGLLTGCSPRIIEDQQATATEHSAGPQVILTSPPTFTLSPEIETPIAAMTVLPPESILRIQPLSVSSELASDVKPIGTLVIWGETLQLVHFDSGVRLETIPGIEFDGCLSTSPDGKWLAHCPLSDDSPTGQWLIVQSADGQQQKEVPMDQRLLYMGSYAWLDNQRLIFPMFQENHRPQAYPMIVINPFTKEQLKLDSNYPDLQFSPLGPLTRMEFGNSDVVYDPTLDLVIYPSAIGHSYIVLWDRKSNSILARVGESIGFYPLWSPDAKQFVVPLLVPKENGNRVEEWFRVTREGQVEQLTHFGDYFTSSEMGSIYKWSPNGQKLAFWLDVRPSLCSGQSLAILDIPTKQVTDTCITSEEAQPVVWSLDSRYIVVSASHGELWQTILVDGEQTRAFDITKFTGHVGPVGWLDSP